MSDSIDVLAIGAHPDDVELGCGATLAVLAQQGYRTGILHLTGGERGTRGSVEERRAEAKAAAAALGAAEMRILDFGDGALRTGEAEEDALIAVLRAWRPEVVLTAPQRDRHPDHGRAHRLTVDACFYAGLARRGPNRGQDSPHRPGAVFSYLQHDLAPPSFIVDVTSGWERKMAALDAYGSQLHSPGRENGRSEAETKISSPGFRAAIEGRGHHFGMLIGADYGEPFLAEGPLAVGDLMHLSPAVCDDPNAGERRASPPDGALGGRPRDGEVHPDRQ